MLATGKARRFQRRKSCFSSFPSGAVSFRASQLMANSCWYLLSQDGWRPYALPRPSPRFQRWHGWVYSSISHNFLPTTSACFARILIVLFFRAFLFSSFVCKLRIRSSTFLITSALRERPKRAMTFTKNFCTRQQVVRRNHIASNLH